MANNRKGNMFYVDTTTSQVNIETSKVQVVGVVLNRGTAGSDPVVTLSDYHTSSPVPMIKLQLDTNLNTYHYDFSSNPISFPSGLCVPTSGLTTNANATIILSKNESRN